MGKLGDTLRERRMALGISMDQAEQHTKMRARLLEALENGDYERLPDPGYVRGYISSYARYLELDPLPLLAMYKAETGAGGTVRLDLPQAGQAVAPSGEQHALPLRTGAVALAVIAVLSLSIWGITRFSQGPEPTPPVPVAPTDPVEATTPDDATSSSAATETAAPDPAPVAQEEPEALEGRPFTVRVAVAPDGASWVRIVVDGRPAYEGTLAGGQSKSFEVTDEASVRIGKPESVTVTRDGQPVDIKNNGDVPTVTLKAEQSE